MAPQIRLYISEDQSKRLYYPRTDVIPDGYSQQLFICPVTGDTWSKRSEFWKHIKKLKLDPNNMTYDRVSTCENNDLINKSQLDWIWNHYLPCAQ